MHCTNLIILKILKLKCTKKTYIHHYYNTATLVEDLVEHWDERLIQTGWCQADSYLKLEKIIKIISNLLDWGTIFGLKMMVKSGLENIILKFHEPLQRYLLTCQANSAFLGRIFALGSNNSEGARGISKYFFLDHFSPSFLSQIWIWILVHLF